MEKPTIDGRAEPNELTDEDLQYFAETLTERLDGDWDTIPAEDDAWRPETQIGYTQTRENTPDDHLRVIIRATTDETFILSGTIGTLDHGEYTRETAIMHIECDDAPEVDLSARDAVRDIVQMLAENVENGVYFDADE